MLQELTAKTYIVAMPATKPGTSPTEIARILASETNQQLVIMFNRDFYKNKTWIEGIPLAPAFARHLGQALIQAADVADKAWPKLEEPKS